MTISALTKNVTHMTLKPLFIQSREAARQVASLSTEQRNRVLLDVADAIETHTEELLQANKADLARMDRTSPLYDRLMLTAERLEAIAQDMRHVAALQSPLDITLEERILPNGLRLRRMSVPFGVVGVVYEARPNVTFDVFSLCMKSGNACILKGGKDADISNQAIMNLIHQVLQAHGLPHAAATLLPATHEATAQMLEATGYIDVCIPRGGKKLIEFVRDTARIPVIETGAGVVHTYVAPSANLDMAARIIHNGKTRRVSVCNALDTLLVHDALLDKLDILLAPLAQKQVRLHADATVLPHLGFYPSHLISPIQGNEEEVYHTEYMDYAMGIHAVSSTDEAIRHIAQYGSGHSESIVTSEEPEARRFQREVDAACVYWNAPTSFTDGGQFGLGAEIGISTQKLGPRGPMGLSALTTYKWMIDGEGQTRP